MESWLASLAVIATVTMATTAQSLRSNPGVYVDQCSLTGVQQPGIATEELCLTACQRVDSCAGIEFFLNNCFFHTEATICAELSPVSQCTQYKLFGCTSCIGTYLGNAKGANCVFPFIYRGEVFTNCTLTIHDRLWCATTESYDANREYGNCLFNETNCPETTTVATTAAASTTTVESSSAPLSTASSSSSSAASTTDSLSTTTRMAATTTTERATTTVASTTTATSTTPFIPVTAVTDAAGCTTRLKAYPDHFAFFGESQPYSTEEQCMSICLELSQCLGLNYNFVFNLCFFFFQEDDVQNFLRGVGTNHYIKEKQCPVQTLKPGTCVDTFDLQEGQHGFDGDRLYTARDMAACSFACLADVECIAFDFNFGDAACYLYTGEVGQLYDLNGTTHFVRVSCKTTTEGSTTTPTAPTTPPTTTVMTMSTVTVGCVDTFEAKPRKLAFNGNPVTDAETVEMCQAACLAESLCRSVDFDEDHPEQQSCYWHSVPEDSIILRDPIDLNANITHYARIDCNAQTTAVVRNTVTMKGCEDTFREEAGIGAYEGKPDPRGVTETTCRRLCLNSFDCYGFDFVPTNAEENLMCFHHFNKTVMENSRYRNQFSTHYVRLNCSITVTEPTPSDGPSSPSGCVDSFEDYENYRGDGGAPTPREVLTIQQCEDFCLQNRFCAGFDYDPLHAARCFTHTLLTRDRVVRAPGVTHYRRVECEDTTPTQTPPTGCVDTFEVQENRFQFDGRRVFDESTLQGCMRYCRELVNCTGFEFVKVPAPVLCYVFFDVAQNQNLYSASWVDHYSRNACGTGTTPSETTVTGDECVERYEVAENILSGGGTPVNDVTGPQQCKDICSNNATCLGFDFWTDADSGDMCYIHTDEEDFSRKVERPFIMGVSQYTRIRCEATTLEGGSTMTTAQPPSPRCPAGPPLANITCGDAAYSQSCPSDFYCETHPGGFYAVCCEKLLEGECDSSKSVLVSSADNLYGDDLIDRGQMLLETGGQRTFINRDRPLPSGILNEFYLYVGGNTEFDDFPKVALCLEIWRPVVGVNLGYQLIYRKQVLIDYSSTEGSFCKFNVRADGIEIEAGDMIGWTNKLDFVPISMMSTFDRALNIRNIDRFDNDSLALPIPNEGVYVFDSATLAAIASLAVTLEDLPPPGCEGNPCVNGECIPLMIQIGGIEMEDFVCDCLDGFTGRKCESELGICIPNPCKNGGTCSTLPGQSNSFKCACMDGFSGEICETDMPVSQRPVCMDNWQVILNRIYPHSVGFGGIESEEACRARCLKDYPACTAIEYMEDRGTKCRIHFNDVDLLEEYEEESPGNRHIRLIERCTTPLTTEPIPTTTTTVTTTTQSTTETATTTLPDSTSTASTTTATHSTSMLPATTSTDGDCVPQYDVFENRYASNGLPFDNVTSLEDCRMDCEVQPTCTGFNFVTSGGVMCWQLRLDNSMTGPAAGSTFYKITSGCFEQSMTTTSPPETGCRDHFSEFENAHVPNAQPYQEISTLVGCINRCVAMEDCVGFNFVMNIQAMVRCSILTDTARLEDREPVAGIFHYVIHRCTENNEGGGEGPQVQQTTTTESGMQGAESGTTGAGASVTFTMRADTNAPECSTDLVFVVDGSGSISDDDITNWQKVRDFLGNVVEAIPKETVSVRVAAVTFANRGNLKFDFDDYLDHDDIEEKLRNLPYGGGRSNTTGGLRVMRTELFRSERGDRFRVKNVVIVLTDGGATVEAAGLKREAELVRQTGSEIFAIGVTSRVNVTQMVQLVTEPFYNHYFRVNEFTQLMQALEFVMAGTCLGLTPAPDTVTVPPPEPITDGCSPDIAFLVDASGSIQDHGRKNWGTMKTFLKSVVNLLNISEARTHVGAVSFSNMAKLEFRFLGRKQDILNNIDGLTFAGGFTNTTGAFRLARTVLYTGDYGARPTAQDIYILITDGFTNREKDKLNNEIAMVKATGARILAIGVTNATNEVELMSIVSQPQYYHRVENFNGLMNTLNSVIDNTGACAPIPQDPVQVCIKDLALLVDSSGSIEDKGKGNYDLIKDFLKSVIDGLNIGPSDVHVGAITFSNTAVYEFGFRDNKMAIFDGINRLTYEGGFTNTTGAFREARQRLFTNEGKDRGGVGDMILLITDGRTTREVSGLKAEVQRHKNSGRIVMAIGVTNAINEAELLSVVSDQKYYYRVQDFDRLMDTLGNLLTSSGCA